MTYETTSNLGLIYFDDSVPGKDWAETVAGQNNDILNSYISQVKFQSYSPTMSVYGDFIIGNSDVQGAYLELPDRWVMGWFRFILGSSFRKGEGIVAVTLPFEWSEHETWIDHNLSGADLYINLGRGFYRDSDSVPNSQTLLVRPWLEGRVYFTLQAFSGRDVDYFSTEYFNLKEGDGLTGNFFYRRAE